MKTRERRKNNYEEMKNAKLTDFICEKIKNHDFAVCSICGIGSLFISYADTEKDPVAWDLQCDRCGEAVAYSWMKTIDSDKIIAPSRQTVKYGKKTGTCDGEDLTPYITKCGQKYWLDDFIRYM